MHKILSYSEFINEAANGQLDKSELEPIKGAGSSNSKGHVLNDVAAKAYSEMVAAAEADGISWEITDSYRDYEAQVDVAARKGLYNQGGLAAVPGTSNHGWGSAVDLKLNDEALAWMRENADKFGFTNIPREPWHWEHKASVAFAKTGKEDPNAGKAPASVIIDAGLVNRLISELKKKNFDQKALDKFSVGTRAPGKGANFKGGSGFPEENMTELEKAMDRHGITNEFARKAILGVISKESPRLADETSYFNTPIDRIRYVYSSKLSKYSDEEIEGWKKLGEEEFDKRFWEAVYGGLYGNTSPGDGTKYRGRGFNGITFKGNYENLQERYEKEGSKIGKINIVENPELLMKPEVAAEFAVLFFIDTFEKRRKDLNNYSDLESAVTDYVQANAGWGSSLTGVKADGLGKALAFAQSLETTQTA
jgi:predicted chitinase/D-alanyl-D-alanine dipeptidase